MIPRSTEDACPVMDSSNRLISWSIKSLAMVISIVEKTRINLNAIRRDMADEWISAWHAAPGKLMAEAIPISVTRELLKRSYPDGNYYVRIRTGDGPDEASFYQAQALGAEDDVRPADGYRTLETTLSRALDTEQAINHARSDELLEVLGQQRTTRAELEDSRANLEVAKRTITRLEEELAAAKQDAEPLFDDKTALKLLEVAQLWATMPAGGLPEKNFTRLFAGVLGLLGSIERDPIIMASVVARHSDAWLQFRGAFNEVAEASKTAARLQSVEAIAELLPPGYRPAPRTRATAKKPARATKKAARATKKPARASAKRRG